MNEQTTLVEFVSSLALQMVPDALATWVCDNEAVVCAQVRCVHCIV